MDPRIREHAAVAVDHSTRVEPGDNVVIVADATAEDLAVALHERIGDVGANPIFVSGSQRARRAFLRARDEFETPSHELALIRESDVVIHVRGATNATEGSDIPSETEAAYSRASKPVREERLTKRWLVTQYPASGNAQLAEMSREAYENFVWDAVLQDWEQQGAHQEQLVDILEPAADVRIVSGDATDLSLSIKDNHAVNDSAEHNLPGGEVFTAPVVDSVEGTVLFDKPLYHQSREIIDPYLEFKNGEVVEYSASKHESVLGEVLDTDEGARRLGELGIGMNRNIDRFTYNVLFDEKMGDTVHLAVGMAYDECVGNGNEVNESAVHVDMIVGMEEDSRIEVDGEVIQQNGRFVFEDGFPS